MTPSVHLHNVTVTKTRYVEFHEPLWKGLFGAVVVTVVVVVLILAVVFFVGWLMHRRHA